MEPTRHHVTARARPIRVAYLIPWTETSHPILDEAMKAASSYWGGRFSLIVPCKNGQPICEFEAWLELFDADVIYSYVELTGNYQQHLHEWLGPSELRIHQDHTGTFRPVLPIGPLSVNTVIPLIATENRAFFEGPMPIVELAPSVADDLFLKQNFGSLTTPVLASRGGINRFISRLLVCAPGEMATLSLARGESDRRAAGAIGLLSVMSDVLSAKSIVNLAAATSSHWRIRHPAWNETFHIVVGDTVDDRLLFWNGRFLAGHAYSGEHVDLFVPANRLDDPSFVDALATFLERRNSVYSSRRSLDINSVPSITLRSISLDEDSLSSYAERLQDLLADQRVTYEKLSSLATLGAIYAPHTIIKPRQIRGEPDYSTTESTLALPTVTPHHFRYVPPELLDPSDGHWAVDVDLGGSPTDNPVDSGRWRLPRRIRVALRFCLPYSTYFFGPEVQPRSSAEGYLTVFSATHGHVPTLNVPTPREAIEFGLQHGRAWRDVDGKAIHDLPQSCYFVEQSDAGQHFYGVLKTMERLDVAGALLMNTFWRGQLEKFGATDQRAMARHPDIVKRIRKRLGSKTMDLSRDEDQEVLANLILQEADAERLTTPTRSWAQMLTDFEHAVDNGDLLSPNPIGTPHEKQRLREGLADCVRLFCEKGILHQGYELRCPSCLHRNWIAIDRLAVTIPCHVCRRPMTAPFEHPWQFRLNEFLREALRRHGIGPLFWVLDHYKREHSSSLWFEGPLNIYFEEADYMDSRPNTDIDLTMVASGKVVMCEAKQSERAFTKPEALADSMKRLRPDIALLAVMERESPALLAKYQRFAAMLDGTGVRPRLMTLQRDDFSTSSMFF